MVTSTYLQEVVKRYGEVFVVLESGVKYTIHGTEGFEMEFMGGRGNHIVTVEGFQDGEYLIVEFPVEAIEHIYTHREV